MNTKWLVCRSFLEQKKKETSEAFSSFLPPSIQKDFLSVPLLEPPLYLGFDLTNRIMTSLHYSWFALFLRKLPKQEISLFISLFSKEIDTKLRNHLLFFDPPVQTSALAQSFLQKKIVTEITKEQPDLLPAEALPPSPLNALLAFSADELYLLADFLGLRDLATELTQIIDTVRLKQIYAALSKEKQTYLAALLRKQEPVSFKRMDIHKGPFEKEAFLSLLHKRGVNRLAKAFYQKDKSLIWYITHQMSHEEASLFLPLCKQLESPRAHNVLIEQVLEIASFIKKHPAEVAS